MGKDCVRFENVYKKYDKNRVLRGLSFTVNEGEILALLGHNGAGKTTVLRLILGLLEWESGEIEVFGENIRNNLDIFRKDMGVLSESTGLYESLSVYDNLKFFAKIYDFNHNLFEEKIDYLLKKFDIFKCKNQIIKNFSQGTKKKVAIIRTLFHNPRLVLMDEPTNALDPVSVCAFHDIVKEMKQELGTSFIITTHNLDEVVKICDSVVILKNGKSIYENKFEIGSDNTVLETWITIYNFDIKQVDVIAEIMNKFFADVRWNMDDNRLILKNSDEALVVRLVKELVYKDIGISDLRRNNFSLEQIYLDANMETEND